MLAVHIKNMSETNSSREAGALDAITGKPMPKPIPAATLVIFRDQPGSNAPELLMVERSAKMVFAAGAAVFPGGRIDDADFEYARALGHDDFEEYGARIAAVRESIEETGIAVAVDGNLDGRRCIREPFWPISATSLTGSWSWRSWFLLLAGARPSGKRGCSTRAST